MVASLSCAELGTAQLQLVVVVVDSVVHFVAVVVDFVVVVVVVVHFVVVVPLEFGHRSVSNS